MGELTTVDRAPAQVETATADVEPNQSATDSTTATTATAVDKTASADQLPAAQTSPENNDPRNVNAAISAAERSTVEHREGSGPAPTIDPGTLSARGASELAQAPGVLGTKQLPGLDLRDAAPRSVTGIAETKAAASEPEAGAPDATETPLQTDEPAAVAAGTDITAETDPVALAGDLKTESETEAAEAAKAEPTTAEVTGVVKEAVEGNAPEASAAAEPLKDGEATDSGVQALEQSGDEAAAGGETGLPAAEYANTPEDSGSADAGVTPGGANTDLTSTKAGQAATDARDTSEHAAETADSGDPAERIPGSANEFGHPVLDPVAWPELTEEQRAELHGIITDYLRGLSEDHSLNPRNAAEDKTGASNDPSDTSDGNGPGESNDSGSDDGPPDGDAGGPPDGGDPPDQPPTGGDPPDDGDSDDGGDLPDPGEWDDFEEGLTPEQAAELEGFILGLDRMMYELHQRDPELFDQHYPDYPRSGWPSYQADAEEAALDPDDSAGNEPGENARPETAEPRAAALPKEGRTMRQDFYRWAVKNLTGRDPEKDRQQRATGTRLLTAIPDILKKLFGEAEEAANGLHRWLRFNGAPGFEDGKSNEVTWKKGTKRTVAA